MHLYRIAKEQYLENYKGLGASYADGGRWNRPGVPVLYFALSAPVAMLEMAHYTSSPRMVPPSYRMGVFEVPDDTPLARLEKKDWPQDWSDYPFPLSTQKIGTDWLQKGGEFGLIVPSCAVPGGFSETLVVNPLHKVASEIRLLEARNEIYNPRAFRNKDTVTK